MFYTFHEPNSSLEGAGNFRSPSSNSLPCNYFLCPDSCGIRAATPADHHKVKSVPPPKAVCDWVHQQPALILCIESSTPLSWMEKSKAEEEHRAQDTVQPKPGITVRLESDIHKHFSHIWVVGAGLLSFFVFNF